MRPVGLMLFPQPLKEELGSYLNAANSCTSVTTLLFAKVK